MNYGQIGPLSDQAPPEGLSTVIIKPSIIGGIEPAMQTFRWAQAHGMRAIVTTSFESGIGVALLVQIAAAMETIATAAHGQAGLSQSNPATHEHMNRKSAAQATSSWHGLSTFDFFQQDVLTSQMLYVRQEAHSKGIGNSLEVANSWENLKQASLGLNMMERAFQDNLDGGYTLSSTFHKLGKPLESHRIRILGMHREKSMEKDKKALPRILFLHGFMGCAEDWVPLMEGLMCCTETCVALDLPCHGESSVRSNGQSSLTLDLVVNAVGKLVTATNMKGCILAGYSMGARLALLLVHRFPELFSAVVPISGSPGLLELDLRRRRTIKDVQVSEFLERWAFRDFLEYWYAQPLWTTLRQHPLFSNLLHHRAGSNRIENRAGLAAMLREMSVGHMTPLWQHLPSLRHPLLLIVGADDKKFSAIANHVVDHMTSDRSNTLITSTPCPGHGDEVINAGNWQGLKHAIEDGKWNNMIFKSTSNCALVEMRGCGHAVVTEAPLQLLHIFLKFLQHLPEGSRRIDCVDMEHNIDSADNLDRRHVQQ